MKFIIKIFRLRRNQILAIRKKERKNAIRFAEQMITKRFDRSVQKLEKRAESLLDLEADLREQEEAIHAQREEVQALLAAGHELYKSIFVSKTRIDQCFSLMTRAYQISQAASEEATESYKRLARMK